MKSLKDMKPSIDEDDFYNIDDQLIMQICRYGYFSELKEDYVSFTLNDEEGGYEYDIGFHYDGTPEGFVAGFIEQLESVSGLQYVGDMLGQCEDLNDLSFYLNRGIDLENDAFELNKDLRYILYKDNEENTKGAVL